MIIAEAAGVVDRGLRPTTSTIEQDDGGHRPTLAKFTRSNQGTSYNQQPLVNEGDTR